MTRVFYQVEVGSAAFAFCEAHAAECKAVKKAYADFAEANGARGWTEGFTRLRGLIFDYGAAIPAGLKADRQKTSDGKTVHSPRRNIPEGKVLIRQIEALPPLPSQSQFSEHFGVPGGLRYKGGDCISGAMRLSCGGFESSLIAWTKPGEYWVVLPDIDTEIARLQEKGSTVEPSSWTVPEGLKRSSEARYDLAVAQARVEAEEA